MAVPVVAAVTTATDSAADTTVDVDKPTGTASGDVLYIVASNDQAAGTITTPTGFAVQDFISGGGGVMYLFSRRADGSEAATFTVTYGGSNFKNVVCLRVTGVDASVVDLTHQYAELADASSATGHTSPSITTTLTDCLVLSAFATDTAGVSSMAPAGSEVELADVSNPSRTQMVLGVYSTDAAAAGTYDHDVTFNAAATCASMTWAIQSGAVAASTGGSRMMMGVG